MLIFEHRTGIFLDGFTFVLLDSFITQPTALNIPSYQAYLLTDKTR